MKIVFRVSLAALALALATACASGPPKPSLPPRVVQKVLFRVTDLEQKPLPGAVINLSPTEGKPAGPGHLVADRAGEALLAWLPSGRDEAAAMGSKDVIFSFSTDFRYQVSLPGYLTWWGRVKQVTHGQDLATRELRHMSRAAIFKKMYEEVFLRRRDQLLGRGLVERPDDHPAVSACLEFWRLYGQQVRRLGLRFANPAFELRHGVLTVRLRWRDYANLSAKARRALGEQIHDRGPGNKVAKATKKKAAPKPEQAGSAQGTPNGGPGGQAGAPPSGGQAGGPPPGGKGGGPGGKQGQGPGDPKAAQAKAKAKPLPKGPLAQRVGLDKGLPMTMVLANSALAASGAEKLKLVFVCEIENAKDVYAEPEIKTVVMECPARAARDLARGRVAPLKFLRQYPARLLGQPGEKAKPGEKGRAAKPGEDRQPGQPGQPGQPPKQP